MGRQIPPGTQCWYCNVWIGSKLPATSGFIAGDADSQVSHWLSSNSELIPSLSIEVYPLRKILWRLNPLLLAGRPHRTRVRRFLQRNHKEVCKMFPIFRRKLQTRISKMLASGWHLLSSPERGWGQRSIPNRWRSLQKTHLFSGRESLFR